MPHRVTAARQRCLLERARARASAHSAHALATAVRPLRPLVPATIASTVLEALQTTVLTSAERIVIEKYATYMYSVTYVTVDVFLNHV